MTGEHESAIRRGCTPVACHVPTRAHLYRQGEIEAWLSSRPAKPQTWDEWDE